MNSILKDIRRASLTIEHVVVVINMKERFEKRKLECAFSSFCVFSRYLKVKRMGSHLAMSDYCSNRDFKKYQNWNRKNCEVLVAREKEKRKCTTSWLRTCLSCSTYIGNSCIQLGENKERTTCSKQLSFESHLLPVSKCTYQALRHSFRKHCIELIITIRFRLCPLARIMESKPYTESYL